MISIETRLENYKRELNNTLEGFAKAIETEKDLEKLNNYKNITSRVENILDFGLQDYYAMSKLPSIIYFSENYKGMSQGLFDSYVKGFGIEINDEMYNTIKMENDNEKVKNMIWQDCLGMEYGLMSQYEAIAESNNLLDNKNLTQEEIRTKQIEIMCKSGYYAGKISNPTHSDLNEIRTAMNKILEEKNISRTM